MLLLSLLDTDTPIEKFLKGCVQVQNVKNTVLSTVQICILHDLYQAAQLKEEGKLKTADVPLQHIQKKYDLERYTVSRNAAMLSDAEFKDKNQKSGKRQGRGYITIRDYKADKNNKNTKSMVLTNQGRTVAQLIFNR